MQAHVGSPVMDGESNGEPVSVVLVDDNLAFLEAIEGFLSVDRRVRVVGRASSGPSALEQVEQVHPAVVVLDLFMPGMNGLEAARLIKQVPCPPRVVVLTLYEEPQYRQAAEAAGADGYVTKSEMASELVPVILEIAKGNKGASG